MKHWIVVTSINRPTKSVDRIAYGAQKSGWKFVIAGDTKTPDEAFFDRSDIDYISITDQEASGTHLATCAPKQSYTRKMFGYLHAMKHSAQYIVDTDDDNWPKDDFFADRDSMFAKSNNLNEFSNPVTYTDVGWLNIYRHFAPSSNIWPRGFPLSLIGRGLPLARCAERENFAVVLQGLADGSPDVDAIHRLVYPDTEFKFQKRDPIQLSGTSWCAFNSQNTTWAPEAFLLMYLPSTCSFRMTDIYRGYITQRILIEMGRSIIFHGSTVHQDRNEHNIIHDFLDEMDNYRDDGAFIKGLSELKISNLSKADMLRRCYEFAIKSGYCRAEEMITLDAWISDCRLVGAL